MASANISSPSPQTLQSHINTGTANANPTWRDAALAATMRLARRREQFTAYEVQQELAKSNLKTHDLRAMGGILLEAKELGIITSAGLVRRNDAHTRGASTLWQSRLCQTTQTAHTNTEPSGEVYQPQSAAGADMH
jgi:hypothetical protein